MVRSPKRLIQDICGSLRISEAHSERSLTRWKSISLCRLVWTLAKDRGAPATLGYTNGKVCTDLPGRIVGKPWTRNEDEGMRPRSRNSSVRGFTSATAAAGGLVARLGVSLYEKARPSTWWLAFFARLLLGDKVSGNLESSLLRPKSARSSTFSPQTRPLQSQVRLSGWMAARSPDRPHSRVSPNRRP